MMEGKAGVSMESRKKMSRAKSNSPMKRTVRRAVAWLLVFCMCMANMNSAVYAAEIATSSDALMAATPSDAAATDSNAAEILMPEQTVSGEELKEEAIRAISAGHEFDFDSEIRVMKDAEGKNESYSELFKGYRSFTLFADNGNGGRLTGGNDNAYGYIVVRVDKDAYEAFEKEEGTARATGSDATGSSAAERVWSLTGDEELIFLYVNADNGTVTFSLNIENLEADDIVVPSRAELYEDTEEEAEETSPAEKPAEDANEAGGSSSGGGSGSGSGSSGDVQDDPTDEGASDDSQAEDGQTDDSQTENDSENDTDAEKPDEKPEDGQTGGGSENGQENNDSSNTDKEDGNTDSGNDGNTGNSEDNGSNSDSGNDNHGNADSGNTGNTENSGNSGSGSGSESGKDEGGSSDKGDSSDKGGSDSGSGSSNSGNSGNSGNTGSSNSGSSSDKGGSDSDSAKLSKSSLNLPIVMGPNPNAEFEEDEFGDMSFDEWQEMMEEEEEEAEEEEDYTDEVSVAYDSEDDGTSYLNMTMLPAVGATVKKAQPKRAFKLFKSSRSDEAEAVVMAGSVPLKALTGSVTGASKKIKYLGGDNYRLRLDLSGGGQPVDVLLAVDISNSMNERESRNLNKVKQVLGYDGWLYEKKSRYEDHKKPGKANGFIDSIFEKFQGTESRMAVVSYGTIGHSNQTWTNDKNTVKRKIGNLAVGKDIFSKNETGGTNYEAGLLEIRKMLESSDPTHMKYVIFLSDGNPTYTYSPANAFAEPERYDVLGNGKSDEYDLDDSKDSKYTTGQATIDVSKQFRNDPYVADATIYSVGIGMSDSGKKYLSAVSSGNEEDASNVYTGSVDELKSMFDSLFQRMDLENVIVSDPLSPYVQLPDNDLSKADVSVYKYLTALGSGEGHRIPLDVSQVTVNNSTGIGKVQWDMSSVEKDGKLDPDYTYVLEFNIQVSPLAKTEYAENGYPAGVVGSEETDFGDKITSAGQPGFYANGSSTADNATITWNGNDTGYKYPMKPVVQVIETPKVQYNKKAIQSTDNKEIYDLILDVTGLKKTPDSSTTTTASTDIVFVLDQSPSMLKKLGELSGGWWEPDNRPTRADVVNDSMGYILSDETGVFKYSDGQKQNIRVKGYLFTGKTSEKPGSNQWFTSSSAAKRDLKVTPNRGNGGTMPKDALEKAVTALKNSNADLKYIIYLTDGEPNTIDGGGLSTLSNSKADGKNIKVYPISIHDAPETNWGGNSGTYMEQVVEAAKQGGMSCDGVYSGVTADEIKQVFKQITGSIVTEIEQLGSGMTNVVISDELSEYAEFVSKPLTEGAFTVTAEDGTPVAHTVAFNETEKKFSISFAEPLEDGVTYQVKVRIKPTQAAMDHYAQNGTYPNKPDAGTGTHADKKESGFYSNTEATLSFSYNGVTYAGDNAFEYPHPVIQILPEGRFVVQKLVEIDNNETPLAGSPDQEFIIQIQEQTADGTNGFKSSVALKDGEMTGTVITEGEKTFNVHEIVPMEYEQSSIVVYENDGNGNPKPGTAKVVEKDGNFTVLPGQDLIVRVTNIPVHKNFFHHAVSVTNTTKGDTKTPFSNGLAEQAAKTASRLGLTKKKTELEQEEGDLIA